MAKIEQHTKRFRKSVKRAQVATKNFSNKMMGMQNTLTSVAGVIGGTAVVSQFMGYQEAMNQLNAVTLAGDDVMDRFGKTAKELGAKTKFSASEVANAMTFLAMAGMETDQVLGSIEGTLQLAAAGNIDLAAAADIATNVLAQMQLPVEQLGRVNDVLALAQAKSNMNILQAAEAMRTVGGTANTLGISLEETVAMIGAMADAGNKGTIAGTLLRNAMIRLAGATPKAQKVLGQLGINLREFVTPEGKIKNFTKLIAQLSERGATATQIFQIFEMQGGRAILDLIKKGKPALDKLTQSLEDSAGTAEKMTEIQMKGLPGVWREMKSALEALNIAIFESGLSGFLVDTFKGLTNWIRALSKSNPLLLKVIAIIGGIVAVGGPLLIVLGMAASAISGLIGLFSALAVAVNVAVWPLTLIVVGVMALIAAVGLVWYHWDRLINLIKKYPILVLVLGPIMLLVGGIKILIAAVKYLWKNWEWIWSGMKQTVIDVWENSPIGKIIKGVQYARSLFNRGGDTGGVAAEGANAMRGTLGGRIDITAEGAKVERAELGSDIPGDLGFNMAGGS